jgi:serine/threonine protein kinase
VSVVSDGRYALKEVFDPREFDKEMYANRRVLSAFGPEHTRRLTTLVPGDVRDIRETSPGSRGFLLENCGPGSSLRKILMGIELGPSEATKEDTFSLIDDLKGLFFATHNALLEFVERAHRGGVYHCDIKTENTLVCNGYVKLIDFGAAEYNDNKDSSRTSPFDYDPRQRRAQAQAQAQARDESSSRRKLKKPTVCRVSTFYPWKVEDHLRDAPYLRDYAGDVDTVRRMDLTHGARYTDYYGVGIVLAEIMNTIEVVIQKSGLSLSALYDRVMILNDYRDRIKWCFTNEDPYSPNYLPKQPMTRLDNRWIPRRSRVPTSAPRPSIVDYPRKKTPSRSRRSSRVPVDEMRSLFLQEQQPASNKKPSRRSRAIKPYLRPSPGVWSIDNKQ